MVDQAVILAAGRGTRLQKEDPSVQLDERTLEIARLGIKALVPIGGRAYLDYGIDRLIAAGIRRICLVIAPGSEPLEEYVAHLGSRFPGLEASCVIQPEPRGTAHAVRFAQPFTTSADFLLVNSDNLYPAAALREMAAAPHADGAAMGFEEATLVAESNFGADRVTKLGVLVPQRDDPGRLTSVVEKPDDPSSYFVDGHLWITMNLWRFSSKIYEYCERTGLSARGEYELTSAVDAMIQDGLIVRLLRCRAGVLDLTSRSDIIQLEEILTA